MHGPLGWMHLYSAFAAIGSGAAGVLLIPRLKHTGLRYQAARES